ncbi:MAG TPA: hypothetical protein GXZ43_06170 [Clostridiaceae bacterium]|nr:hypothetical protein [Clostridiaceae bacterium]
MKKLIIVCEERLRRYGDFLAQLISGKDDRDGKVVGIKDSAAAAQVWTEKEYASNAAQISSEQYLLFIGNSKLIKEKRHHMQKKYSEHGMNYGWLGKQAVLFVDHTLSFAEYEDFYKFLTNEYAEGSQIEAVRLLPSKSGKTGEPVNVIEDSEEIEDAAIVEIEEPAQQEEKVAKKLLEPIAFVGKALKKAVDNGVNVFNKVTDDINAASKSKDIEDQQYTCLVLLFYLNDLALFLGLNEE